MTKFEPPFGNKFMSAEEQEKRRLAGFTYIKSSFDIRADEQRRQLEADWRTYYEALSPASAPIATSASSPIYLAPYTGSQWPSNGSRPHPSRSESESDFWVDLFAFIFVICFWWLGFIVILWAFGAWIFRLWQKRRARVKLHKAMMAAFEPTPQVDEPPFWLNTLSDRPLQEMLRFDRLHPMTSTAASQIAQKDLAILPDEYLKRVLRRSGLATEPPPTAVEMLLHSCAVRLSDWAVRYGRIIG